MDDGPLPPIPDLIPISAIRKRPPSNNNSVECTPCASNRSEVMGEQRPRRRSANQPAVELIDNTGSRGLCAAPQAPLSRKVRPERHRKSDRRRERRKVNRTRSKPPREINSSQTTVPPNPRVNPIFVWVRQEDTHIVDVKCEDYDKRNRILLTKTAQGWRAIPRTETLVPILKEAVSSKEQHHHHHHKNKKTRKSKVRRRSTGVQVSSDIEQDYEDHQQQEEEEDTKTEEKSEETEVVTSPPWMSSDNINVESLLPSHTIQIKRSTSPNGSSEQNSNVNVNSVVSECAQSPNNIKCSADKICDVSPLDNLLAVAELEFKQQIESEEWNKTPNEETIVTFNNFSQSEEDKEFMKNLETLNNLIDSEKSKLELTKDVEDSTEEKTTDECDYNDEDDNNLAMDDILSRLEQSLRSPENSDPNHETAKNKIQEIIKEVDTLDDINKSVQDFENFFSDAKDDKEKITEVEEEEEEKQELINLVESSTNDDEEEEQEEEETPKDLSMKNTKSKEDFNNIIDEPTDLTVPKSIVSPRPHSQNSEAIQSPQPSGIPAVPQSPDIVSTTVNVSNKPKSVFLESLLTNTSTKKIALNSEVTITAQREPLDLGKCRKSASPTVTCSEEINNSQSEPPMKKIKSTDITLKTLLDADPKKSNSEKNITVETPKLLELLQNDSDSDPLVQLKQLLSDPSIDVPDPLLVPKEKFSQILIHPGTEIPRLLKERPELRLPQALAFPHIMQDPNMLVINIHHLESILSNKNQLQPDGTNKTNVEVKKQSSTTETTQHSNKKKTANEREAQVKTFNELANDINSATQAAFSQMSWFPYMNHLEAMALSNNPDFMKMLNSVHLPFYMNQMPDLLSGLRPPLSPMGFPMPPHMNYGNPMEFNMWQEAMLQAQLLRNKSAENANEQNVFKNYLEKAQTNRVIPRVQTTNKPHSYSNQYHKNDQNAFQNPYGNYNSYQAKSTLPNHPKHSTAQKHSFSSKSSGNSSHQMNQNFANFYSQMSNTEKHQYMQNINNVTSQDQLHQNFQHFMRKEANQHKHKTPCKSFTKSAAHQEHQKERGHPSGSDTVKPPTTQPIDLSGSTTSGGKLKVKQHLIDTVNTPKLLKQHDDVPEVGSTTASIEEMQDAHKHLWHPLFGNQKGYTSPWSWTTVTATGE